MLIGSKRYELLAKIGSDDFISRAVCLTRHLMGALNCCGYSCSDVFPALLFLQLALVRLFPVQQSLPKVTWGVTEYEQISANRDEAIYRSYKSGMYSMKEIGKYFGLHYSRISRIIKQHYIHEAKSKICPLCVRFQVSKQGVYEEYTLFRS